MTALVQSADLLAVTSSGPSPPGPFESRPFRAAVHSRTGFQDLLRWFARTLRMGVTDPFASQYNAYLLI